MAYDIFIQCDQCNTTAKVPQVGANPYDWVLMKYSKPRIAISGDNSPAAEVATLAFCGWGCVRDHVAMYVGMAVPPKEDS